MTRRRGLAGIAVGVVVAVALSGCTSTPQANPPTVSPSASAPSVAPPATAAPPPTASSPASPAATIDPTALPGHSGSGQRIVWSKSANRVWLVTPDDSVVRTFPVSDNDRKTPLGSYRIHRRNPQATSITGAKLAYFLGFYRRPGHTDWIGLHAVPKRGRKYDRRFAALGRPAQKPTPGCIYTRVKDAKATWDFATTGTRVVVVP